MKRIATVVVLCSAASSQVGCATIINGSTQTIQITSDPSGAHVLVDSKPRGETPVYAELERKDTHVIKVQMEGYIPFEMMLTRHVSAWFWGNIALGGLVGFVVDPITGGMYVLRPAQVHAELTQW